jgi:two-component system sensor histidine kinase KdpD
LASVIVEESDRLAGLIDDLLDLSRLEAGASPPRPQQCSVEDVLRDAIDTLPPAAAAEVNLSVRDGTQAIEADPVQLERAFANLLENSSRYGAGQPVSVRIGPLATGTQVRIVDRGPGIPAAHRDRVFEQFFRSGTDETGHRGSGLGLAIARGFIEANGGTVVAESLPGQGTTFVAELPRYWAPPEAEPLKVASA